MSNQGYYPQDQNQNQYSNTGQAPGRYQSNNPYNAPQQQQQQPPQYSGAPSQQQQQQHQQYQSHAPPPGPPPARAGTFREADFVPEAERSHQREMMQQFEMNRQPGNESSHDRDVEMLQREFPSLDGSLIAAIYGDAGNLGATREMLQALEENGSKG